METLFAVSQFYEKAVFIIVCVHAPFSKMGSKKKCKQLVIWPAVLLAPEGKLMLGVKTQQETLREPPQVPVPSPPPGEVAGEHSLFNFEAVLGINCCSVTKNLT